MKYCWTTLHDNDMEKSAEFYNGLIALAITRRSKAGPKMESCSSRWLWEGWKDGLFGIFFDVFLGMGFLLFLSCQGILSIV